MVDRWSSLRPGSTKYLERKHPIFGITLPSIDNCLKSGRRLKQVEPQSSKLDRSNSGDLPNRFRLVGGVVSNGVCGRFRVPRYDDVGYVDMINCDILRSERTVINLVEYGLVTDRAAAQKRTQTH